MMNHEDWLNILGWKTEDLSTLQLVGYSYIKQGKFGYAMTLFEALEILNPSDPYTLQTLGGLYIETKNPYKALNVLEKALKLEPSHEMSQYNRMQALLTLGLKKQALIAAEELVGAKDPHIKNKAEALLLAQLIS